MAGVFCRFFVGSKLKLLLRNGLNGGSQRAFYKKGQNHYKRRKQKRVDIEGKLRNIDATLLVTASTASETNAIPKEHSSTWQHSAQRLSSLRTAEKR